MKSLYKIQFDVKWVAGRQSHWDVEKKNVVATCAKTAIKKAERIVRDLREFDDAADCTYFPRKIELSGIENICEVDAL